MSPGKSNRPMSAFGKRDRRAIMRLSAKLGALITAFLIIAAIQWSYFWSGSVSAVVAAQTIYEQIYYLRVVEQDYATAYGLAEDYLGQTPTADLMMDQLVHFEFAMIHYDQEDYEDAIEFFEEIVTTYGSESLDQSSPDYRVDDAQFMVGYIEHHYGVVALGVGAYQLVAQDYPQSDCRADALFNLASISEESGDTTSALNYYDQLIDEYPNSSFVPQSWIQQGAIYWDAEEFDAAAASYQAVIDDWPQSEQALASIRSLIDVLIDEQMDSCCPFDLPTPEDPCDGDTLPVGVLVGFDPLPGQIPSCMVDNTTAIEQNTAVAVNVFQDTATSLVILQGNADFVERRRDCGQASNETVDDARTDSVTQMQAIAPNDPITIRATLALAQATFDDDPTEALSLVESVIADAQTSGDDDLLVDALFIKARFLTIQGDTNGAITTWQFLLAQGIMDPIRHGQAGMEVALINFNQGGYPLALFLLNILDDPQYGPHLQASAKYYAYRALQAQELDAEAEQKKTELLSEFPESAGALIINAEDALIN